VQRPSSPDPVSEPKAYQDHLLSLLGDDDPAEVQAGTPDLWRSLVTEAATSGHVRPATSEWSVIECLGHAVDAEVVSAARYRWVLAQDEPSLIGYDQDLWVDALHAPRDEDPNELLRLFEPLRSANVALWARSSEEDRARVGIHAERGRESFDLLFRMLAGHDRFHLAQARRALDAVSGG
jgi:DinB superfamily